VRGNSLTLDGRRLLPYLRGRVYQRATIARTIRTSEVMVKGDVQIEGGIALKLA
jgi:hypothetical protein